MPYKRLRIYENTVADDRFGEKIEIEGLRLDFIQAKSRNGASIWTESGFPGSSWKTSFVFPTKILYNGRKHFLYPAD
ncbi:MAG: hypothetical protein GYA55_04585 [SAR324 cluster bacterium]|uniref:Uncharacterized protein n=1 Tax=SAR324 cluster bacterium TaxID=2024889 RepID=A0A7X9IJA7_9DELT|nr:hypothetical protein [SAR324 cluster bacterium]